MKRAAIVGMASWYSGSFARALLAQKDVSLVAAASLGLDDATMQRQMGLTLQGYAERFGGLRLYQTLEELLQAEAVDLAFICAPDRDKARYGAAAIGAGIDTYFAKPMTASLEGIQQILAAARAHPT